MERDFLKNKLIEIGSVKDRKAMIDRKLNISIRRQCALLSGLTTLIGYFTIDYQLVRFQLRTKLRTM